MVWQDVRERVRSSVGEPVCGFPESFCSLCMILFIRVNFSLTSGLCGVCV